MPTKTKYIIDPETGEKIDELRPGDRLLRGKTAEYLADTVELLPNSIYIKAFIRPMAVLADALTGAEMNLVYYCLQFLSYESGMLKNKNGQPLARTNISKTMDLSIQSIDRLLQGLKEKQVMGRNVVGREVQYFMNPWLFMRGKRINKTLYDMFKNSRWAKVHEIK